MANNYNVTPGSGLVIASHDASGVHHQKVILEQLLSGTPTAIDSAAPMHSQLTNLEKDEDAAHSSGDKGIMALAVRKDARTALADSDADYIPLQTDSNGALYINQLGRAVPVVQYIASLTATGSVDAGPNKIHGIFYNNAAATANYIKIYDKGTAATNSDTPIIKIACEAGKSGFVLFPPGIPIANGISLRSTTGNADSDNTGSTANDVSVTLILDN
jgi:hypothetical protein